MKDVASPENLNKILSFNYFWNEFGSEIHLLEILEALSLPLHDGGHPPEGCTLELLAAIEGVPELEEPDIVLGNIVNEVEGDVDLAQGELVVVLVVEDIHKISVEGVDVIQLREIG